MDLHDDHSPGGDVENDDVQNDEVIGQAFRRSLVVLAVIATVVGAALAMQFLRRPEPVRQESEVVLPTVRQAGLISPPQIPLRNVAPEDSGVNFVHHAGKAGEKLLPETMGSGVAVLDYNNDGNADLFFVNSRDWPWSKDFESAASESTVARSRLYRGDGHFHFEDVTEEASAGLEVYGMGVAAADFDNDGDTDLYVTAVGSNVLLRNEGGRFVDATEDAGVAGEESDWSTSSGFVDVDADGWLDLFVCNYVDWDRQADITQNFTLDGQTRAYGPPRAFGGSYSRLYRNLGNGTFEDISGRAGIQLDRPDTGGAMGKAMGVAPVDVDDDGDMDLVVANDTVQNFLFINDGTGTFSETAAAAGIAYDRSTGNARGAMGIDAAHFRGGDSLAIGIGNFANEASALYMSRPGRDQFIDAAMYTGFGPPSRSALTFGLFFWDADLDGRLDVLAANGHLEEEIAATQSSQTYAQAPHLFWNGGPDASSELMLVSMDCVGEGFCEPIVGRGAAYGDFDRDGDQDVVISRNDGPPSLFRNDQQTSHHHLRIDLQGTTSNRDGIGAEVRVTASSIGQSVQTVMPTKSYLSQCEKTLTFGLGESSSVDEVRLRWPSGRVETFSVGEVDTTVQLIEGEGLNVDDPAIAPEPQA